MTLSSHGMPETDVDGFCTHLNELGLTQGMDIVVHSKLLSFGKVIGGEPGAVVYQAIRRVVGEDATIAVPTYVFGADEIAFNRRKTKSVQMGLLSEYLRLLPDAVRSHSPVHSHAAVGPKADLFNQTTAEVSIGPGSDFQLLKDNGFWTLLLGCRYSEGCTYMHHLEAVVEVPYRQWAVTKKSVVAEDGTQVTVEMAYFARNDEGIVEDFDKLVTQFEDAGVHTSAAAPFGNSYLIDTERLDQVGRAVLNADPYAFVSSSE